jgi:hypothetical protein
MYGSDCSVSADGAHALVVDGTRGALVYSRHSKVHRASAWLPGGAPADAYAVTASALCRTGQHAVLQVQPSARRRQRVRQPVLRLFTAGALGDWSAVCDIQLPRVHVPGEAPGGRVLRSSAVLKHAHRRASRRAIAVACRVRTPPQATSA